MTSLNYRGLHIPLTPLGAKVTSDNLFDPNEQVIFDFYAANRNRYKRVLDIGANIGVHSILMAREGWDVRAYEPDPQHFVRLLENVGSHGCHHAVEAHQAAVSDHAGHRLFVRVMDNTTGSHLQGAKQSYGPGETFLVPCQNCRPLFKWADFAKVDCEGHEAALVLTTTGAIWTYLDMLLEVGSEENARAIYAHLRQIVPMWSQKTGWRRVETFADMPVRHQEGSLFVGVHPPFREKNDGASVV